MKNIIYIVLSLFLISSTVQVATAAHHVSEQHQSHICPMHPEVTGNAGDTCPKCGMNLEQAHKTDGDHCPNKGHCKGCDGKTKCEN
ncbi:heavy metal-binding domain-containing protein, partial [Shewanella sp. 10N.286.52.A9]|uniref:heavy metal-binding domain-containing protein n=1 Tax=Shewanella sp. 10N.286.52.A9 TaxID=3229711 RepID=UPI003551700E